MPPGNRMGTSRGDSCDPSFFPAILLVNFTDSLMFGNQFWRFWNGKISDSFGGVPPNFPTAIAHDDASDRHRLVYIPMPAGRALERHIHAAYFATASIIASAVWLAIAPALPLRFSCFSAGTS